MERELFVLFFTDPQRLKRTISDLAARVEAQIVSTDWKFEASLVFEVTLDNSLKQHFNQATHSDFVTNNSTLQDHVLKKKTKWEVVTKYFCMKKVDKYVCRWI
jgi:hypothetical protein